MKKSLAVGWLAFLLCLVAAPALAKAKNDPILGTWKVTTKLTVAYDAVNQSYHPGDLRVEKWRIVKSGKGARLTTPSGRIVGKKIGKAWVFDQWFDTGWGIVQNIHLVARTTSSSKCQGTIEVRYYSAQFGYELGNDAWSFKGKK